MIRNQATVLTVKAFNQNDAVTGDEDNITCQVSIDGGAWIPLDDDHPVESPAGSGNYRFALLASETNGYRLEFNAQSSTALVQVLISPDDVIFTTPNSVFPAEAEVESGVVFGPNGNDYTGNRTSPVAANVRDGVQYGGNGTEFTGTLPVSAIVLASPTMLIENKCVPIEFDFPNVWQSNDYRNGTDRSFAFELDFGEDYDWTGVQGALRGSGSNGSVDAVVTVVSDGEGKAIFEVSFPRANLTSEGHFKYDAYIYSPITDEVITILYGMLPVFKSQAVLVP